ncbi:MAG: 16S rRNA (cytidine(1402)-2'-O)-methyltransferase [Nitrospinae bacterium]|nr:16S rRNA (cytidine(1402)-2'-O)-methyltransferase [Nitrospinota bacterium]
MSGILYIVSTPIGNYDDITLRALNILKIVDEVICEEFKEGRRLLNQYGIDKSLRRLSEHNEKKDTPQIIKEIKEGKNFALITDCGTPVFADTGNYLIKEAISTNIKLVPVPGASSIMSALVTAGIPIDKFSYYGFLSPKSDIRKKELLSIKREMPVILMDTPYRLLTLLKDIIDMLGRETYIILCMDLTTDTEEILRGRIDEVLEKIKDREKKREFVLIIKPKEKRPEHE